MKLVVGISGASGDTPDIMRGLDCFILPSLGEGISNTILEAMASGLPIIATAVGGNVELVQDGLNGSLVPPANPEALAKAIQGLAQQRESAKRMGEKSRQLVEAQYSMAAMVTNYQQLYDRLLGHSTRQLNA